MQPRYRNRTTGLFAEATRVSGPTFISDLGQTAYANDWIVEPEDAASRSIMKPKAFELAYEPYPAYGGA
jgi:hypothetical protein